MTDDKDDEDKSNGWGGSGAHFNNGTGLTFEASLEASRKRNAEYKRQIESGERVEYIHPGRPKRSRKR